MLICQMFHVGPNAAPHKISAVPSAGEKDCRYAEEADIEGPNPEVKEVAPDERAASNAIFSLETQKRHSGHPP